MSSDVRLIFIRVLGIVSMFLLGSVYSSAQGTAPSTLPQQQIHDAVGRLLQSAKDVNCKPGNCRILVIDFTVPSGYTSQLGMQLADQFAQELNSQQNGIQVIDRSTLRTYLERERVSSTTLNTDKAIRWLGKQLRATAVLAGTTESQTSSARVLVALLSTNRDKKGPLVAFTFPYSDLHTVLGSFEPLEKVISNDKWSAATGVNNPGVGRVTPPMCLYCPDPPYPEDARSAKFQGQVVLQVLVSADGKVTDARVMRGAPFGLNVAALDAVKEWKMKPATRGGQPIETSTTIVIGFRLLNSS